MHLYETSMGKEGVNLKTMFHISITGLFTTEVFVPNSNAYDFFKPSLSERVPVSIYNEILP